ncbi:hypothetical protein U1Q18_016164 [Sarracenia purpurea var. burkii]
MFIFCCGMRRQRERERDYEIELSNQLLDVKRWKLRARRDVNRTTASFLSSDLGDPNRSDVCGSNSWRCRTVLLVVMDGASLMAQGEQSYDSERCLVILDRAGGIIATVAGQVSNECRGVPSPVS